MSRKLLALLLSEIQVVRVICCKCKTVIELPIGELARTGVNACPQCKANFDPSARGENLLQDLALVVQHLQTLQDRVEIEFILEIPG